MHNYFPFTFDLTLPSQSKGRAIIFCGGGGEVGWGMRLLVLALGLGFCVVVCANYFFVRLHHSASNLFLASSAPLVGYLCVTATFPINTSVVRGYN